MIVPFGNGHWDYRLIYMGDGTCAIFPVVYDDQGHIESYGFLPEEDDAFYAELRMDAFRKRMLKLEEIDQKVTEWTLENAALLDDA